MSLTLEFELNNSLDEESNDFLKPLMMLPPNPMMPPFFPRHYHIGLAHFLIRSSFKLSKDEECRLAMLCNLQIVASYHQGQFSLGLFEDEGAGLAC